MHDDFYFVLIKVEGTKLGRGWINKDIQKKKEGKKNALFGEIFTQNISAGCMLLSPFL